RPPHRASPVRAEHDQIDRGLRRVTQNLRSRFANQHVGTHVSKRRGDAVDAYRQVLPGRGARVRHECTEVDTVASTIHGSDARSMTTCRTRSSAFCSRASCSAAMKASFEASPRSVATRIFLNMTALRNCR